VELFIWGKLKAPVFKVTVKLSLSLGTMESCRKGHNKKASLSLLFNETCFDKLDSII
jgi:hypothetical protein